MGTGSRRTRTGRLVDTAKALHRRAESRFPLITHLADRMVSVNIFDSATRLAAQSFLTAVPLLFVVAAYAPPVLRHQLVTSIRAVFGLTGPADAEIEQVFQPSTGNLRQATGVIGGLMVLLSATAVSRALQRLCKRAWEIPRAGTRIAPWRWLAWLVLWLSALVLQGPVHSGFGLGAWLGLPLTLVTQILLWWWTQHLLLGGLVRWRPLLPGSVATGAVLTALTVTARLYMPRALNRTLTEYGSVGSVFVLLSWLIVVCVAAALSVTTGAVLAQEPFLSGRLGSPPARRDAPVP
ncbi:YhjD/YihY/BrkB family envelope integrity protein [Streptomyces tropicalis]|uniref:YhjD/YihY/BrkB family envelope integrity protein n=1 Tax=Streptomyces tropicalis TaxID=3034234 RepID=A0ABT6A6G1_9ACTN|nr:YhjD/YihY/BrkB family envelope integrity protein [Streptomyces tropicalis]MDF3300242.1 YhjD/YihY/BrkB family envelope integrity protein [Streptomyces tropicalis]